MDAEAHLIDDLPDISLATAEKIWVSDGITERKGLW
jgi:hypothetical protein